MNSKDEDHKDVQKRVDELQYENVPEVDGLIAKRVVRKFDLHIMPWLFGLWFFAALDRANIGNAQIENLSQDLGLVGNDFNTALIVFYVPYVLVALPSNWIVKHYGAGQYLPGLVIAWGIVDVCMGTVKTYQGLIVARIFLGLCEGGLIGGLVIYIAMFYRRHELALRISLFFSASPFSGFAGGLLATGLGQIEYGGFNKWPWIFFVEGAITIIFGIITFLILPHTPASCKFLTDEEKTVATKRMQQDSQGGTVRADVGEERFSWHWVRSALFNPNTVLLSISNFLIITPIYSFSLFLPTIIRGLGYQAVIAQLFTVPPNFVGFLFCVAIPYASDKLRLRGIFMLVGNALGIIGYVMLLAGTRSAVQYAGTFFVAAGIYGMSPVLMGWLANNLAPHYVRATGTGIQVTAANLSAFVGTFTYLSSEAPRYIAGHSINLGFLCCNVLLVVLDMLYIASENRKRRRGDRDGRLQDADESTLGHKHPRFMYNI